MHKQSLKFRAFLFALWIAATAFALSLFALADVRINSQAFANAAIISLCCGVLSWGAADRLIDMVADSVNAAIARLTAAGRGDLVSPIPDSVGVALPYLPESLDSLFAQVRSSIESANSMALFDPVTALSNRLHFRQETTARIDAATPRQRSALLFIDLDHFKAVNDTLGHAAGDQLLIMVANRLRSIVAAHPGRKGHPNETPVLGRLAGDEFTMFLPHLKSDDIADTVGKAILDALSEPFAITGQSVQIGASIGIAIRPDHGFSLTELMRAADVAMYDAKSAGRDRFRYYTSSLATELANRVRLDNELKTALDESQFMFEFQPQLRLADNQIVTAEALVRWNHPTEGVRTPASFLRAAEESGLIVDIGDWSIDAMAKTIAAWRIAGIGHRLSANISARQFERGNFFDRASVKMLQHGAPLSMLELEISEKLIMESGDHLLRQLEAFRGAGATIVIDNFGTGFSNISRLRSLPFDRVKLDRSLTVHIDIDEMSRNVLHSVVNLVHSVGREAVAEGVETQAQLEILKLLGCDAAQGFAIARPMNEAALRDWASLPRIGGRHWSEAAAS
jgi:diguanylate cyclase